MLEPAQLYKDKLSYENTKHWYDKQNIFCSCCASNLMVNLPDDNLNNHHFVSIDKDMNILGYISYSIDWSSMSAYSFAIISYKHSVEFASDLYKAICDLFNVYHMNRICWSCYTDNPAIRSYRNFIKKYGGVECAYYRQCVRLQDGKLHDSVDFEILAEEFKG